MARVKRGTKRRKRNKKVLKLAEGYYGGRHRLFRTAKEAVDHGLMYAYTGRKEKKRNFRQLWNIRINAAVRQQGLSYSRFVSALKTKGIGLNRKMLSQLAITEPNDFAQLVSYVK